jgi:hypothetical protein
MLNKARANHLHLQKGNNGLTGAPYEIGRLLVMDSNEAQALIASISKGVDEMVGNYQKAVKDQVAFIKALEAAQGK